MLLTFVILSNTQNIRDIDVEIYRGNIEVFNENLVTKTFNPKENLTNYNPIQRILRRIAY